jgi:hypothetical protein
MAHGKSRFRVTTWPGVPLPHPDPEPLPVLTIHAGVFVTPRRELFKDGWEETDSFIEPLEERPPSDRYDEIYLQLFTLDLDDEAAILAWVNEFDTFNIHAQAWHHDPRGAITHPYPKLAAYPASASRTTSPTGPRAFGLPGSSPTTTTKLGPRPASMSVG